MTRTPGVTDGRGIRPAGIVYDADLVPMDGSPEAERALAPAAGLARVFGATVHVIAGAVSRDQRWWYERYLAEIGGTSEPLVAHLSDDPDAAGTIVSTAHRLDPCLVCMATHGRARTAGIVGSTFVAVVARLHAPLVAVGPRVHATDRPEYGHLAVCLDGGTGVWEAVPVAAGLARRLDWRVTLLTVADPGLMPAADDEQAAEAYLLGLASRDDLAGLAVDTLRASGGSGRRTPRSASISTPSRWTSSWPPPMPGRGSRGWFLAARWPASFIGAPHRSSYCRCGDRQREAQRYPRVPA